MDLTEYIGIPYKQYGRSFDGCDCYGLVYLFYKYELGIELPTYLNTYNHDNINSITEIIRKEKELWTKIQTPKKFCCILFNVNGLYNHIGIYLGKNLFLHSAEVRKESCIERITHPFWKTRIEGYYAYNSK